MSNQIDIQEPFKRITAEEAKTLLEKGGVQLIDVREKAEYDQGQTFSLKISYGRSDSNFSSART